MNESFGVWPRRVVTGLILTVPFVYSTSFRDYTFPPKLMLLQIGTLAGLVLTLARPRRVIPAIRPALLSIVLFIAFAAISSAWATDPVPSVLVVSKLLTGFCLVLLVVTSHASGDLPSVARAVALAGAGVALLGIAQHLGFRPLAIPSAGLPSATLGFRNIAAMVMIQSLPFACYLLIDTDKRTARFAVVASGLIAGFLILTRTRGAWIGSLLGLVLVIALILLLRRDLLGVVRTRLIYLSATGVLGVATAALPSGLSKAGPQSIDEKKDTIANTLSSLTSEGGDRGRLTVWERTVDMVTDHVIVGVGAGNWAVQYPRYDKGDTITFTHAPERPHNLILLILSELGAIGLLLWIFILALVFHSAWRAIKKRQHATPWLTLACVWSLLSILVHACFSFPLERVTPSFLLWLAIAMILVLGSETSPGRTWTFWLRSALVPAAALPILTYRLMEFERSVADATQEERRGKWNRVADHTARALTEGRFHAEASHLHGYALNQTGRFKEARSFFAEQVTRRPYDIQLINGYAIALQNTGEHEAAETQFRSALHLVDDTPDIYYNLGSLFMATKRFEDAAGAYEKVRHLEPESADLLFQLGNAQALSGHDAEAIEALEQARHLAPGRSDLYFVLGELYYKNQARHKAERAFRGFLDRAPGPSRYADIAKDRLSTLSLSQP